MNYILFVLREVSVIYNYRQEIMIESIIVFVCRIQRLLIEILILCQHYTLPFVVNSENYLIISDDFLCNFI